LAIDNEKKKAGHLFTVGRKTTTTTAAAAAGGGGDVVAQDSFF